MKQRLGLCLLALLTATGMARAQQGVAKPVLTPAPESAPPPVTPTPADRPTSAPAAIPADYVLGSQDVVMVTVWKEPTLSGPLMIRPDGMISLPLVGDVQAAGLTPLALSANLTERLKKYITDPLVTITVTGIDSQRIYFVGEVARPGPMMLVPGMTFLQAIASAGGLTPFANAKKIYILRGAKGKQTKILFNYKKALKDGNQQGVELAAGDTVVVP